MAANKIVGQVVAIGRSDGNPDNTLDVVVKYFTSGPLTGQTSGELVVTVDMTLNETQVVSAIQTALAAYVDAAVFPAQGFAANDVRGCNI